MHRFINFKGFKNTYIDLMRPMTLLIGRNGSGKTNVIEGVELLAQLASGRPLYEISDLGRGSGNSFEIRGGLQGCVRKSDNQQNFFEFAFDTYSKQNNNNPFFLYNIGVSYVGQLSICSEKLWFNKRYYFEASLLADVLNVTYDNFSRGGNKPSLKLSADRSVLSRYHPTITTQLYDKKVKDGAIREAMEFTDIVKRYLMSAFVFDLHPHLMRQYERIGATQLNKDGSNLSAVLYGIKTKDETVEEPKRLLPKLLAKLKQLPEEPFIDFEFITTQANDVLLALKREDEAIIDARLLSDGTLRALAILTALETIPEHSRMVIEELDNGIHPSRVKLLVDTIWECSHRRNLNVLVTTHNPATLNGLTPEQLDCVVVCHYDPVEKADKLTALPDIPDAEILLQKGSLGDLVTRNVLESYLMPNFAEEQQRKAQVWLDLF